MSMGSVPTHDPITGESKTDNLSSLSTVLDSQADTIEQLITQIKDQLEVGDEATREPGQPIAAGVLGRMFGTSATQMRCIDQLQRVLVLVRGSV